MRKFLLRLLPAFLLLGCCACGKNVAQPETTAKKSYKGISATFVGDSITNGAKLNDGEQTYWQITAQKLHMKEPVGLGVNGSTYSTKSDFGLEHDPLPTRYQAIPQTDLIFIALGSNDFGRNTPLGSVEDQEDVSFCGAINFVLNKLQTQCPDSTIILMTPIIRHDKTTNDLGLTLQDYIAKIKEVAAARNVLVADIHTPTADKMPVGVFDDKVHPNMYGHQIMAQALQTWLEENMDIVLN